MFAVLMGFRISEINGLKYSDIDFVNRHIIIDRQLGRDINKNKDTCKKKTVTTQEIKIKTKNRDRSVDIPDLLFETILEEKKGMKSIEKEEKRIQRR